MATTTLTIPDAQLQRVEDAFNATYSWRPGQGETQAEHLKRRMKEYVLGVVAAYESAAAAESARVAAAASANAIPIT